MVPSTGGLRTPYAPRVRDLETIDSELRLVTALRHAARERLRHASAITTLDTYAHLWPDADESTRAAVGAVIAGRLRSWRVGAAD
jgi:hypothetical protein